MINMKAQRHKGTKAQSDTKVSLRAKRSNLKVFSNLTLILTFFLSLSAFADENPFWTITKNEKGITVKTAKIDVVSRSSDGAWEIKTRAGTSLTIDKDGKLIVVKGTEVKIAQRDLKLSLPGGKQAIIPKGRILTFVDGYLRSVK